MADAGELERLRAENAALNEQVKLLVRTEQRLYRSQNELDVQLSRLRELARFALESGIEEQPADILGRTLELMDATFRIDWAGVYGFEDPRSGLTLVHTLGGAVRDGGVVQPGAVAAAWVDGLPGPAFMSDPEHTAWQAGWEFVRAILPHAGFETSPGGLEVAVLPLRSLGGEGRGLIAMVARRRPTAYFRDSIVAERQLPFLQLVMRHVDRAFENLRLAASLRDRSAQLAASLRTLELTQDELLHAQKMEAVGRLAGGVAHDFNNLLTVILGYASALEGTLPKGDAAQGDVRRILEAGRSAAAITGQLLALGRRQRQQLEPVDLATETQRVAGLLQRLLREDIRLEFDLDRTLDPVHVDRTQYSQVVLNLSVNARDAMPAGGVLTIRVRQARAEDVARSEVPCDPRGYAVLEVRDTGQGMDAATRARAFEPFFTTKGPGTGSGLGLAVVYGIVKQSAGHIFVDSEPGGGTHFRLLFPFSKLRAAAVAAQEPAADASASGEARLVLVVEDEAEIRDVVAISLRSAGYAPVTAAHGAEALEWLDRHAAEPDLVITDVVMPVMGGLALEAELRRRSPGMRVAFMSGYAEELGGGGSPRPFLAKPFTPAELLAFVGAHARPRSPIAG